MTRSMNGRPLPEDGREMPRFLAYLDMLTADAGSFGNPAEDPEPLPAAASAPDPVRGQALYLDACAACHRADGAGMRNGQPGEALGYLHPPLWGPDSFNAAAGMHRLAIAAAFIHDNMPLGTDRRGPDAHAAGRLGHRRLHRGAAAPARAALTARDRASCRQRAAAGGVIGRRRAPRHRAAVRQNWFPSGSASTR